MAFDFGKFASTVLYFLHSCPVQPGITGLNKMLFFADYEHYRRYLRPITGLRYVALENGPVPDNYRALFAELESSGYVESRELPTGLNHGKREFIPLVKPLSEAFVDSELGILRKVVDDCGSHTGSALAERSHREGPWVFVWDAASPGREIPYTAFRWLDNLPSDDELTDFRALMGEADVRQSLEQIELG